MKDDQHYIDKIFSEALADYQELPDEGAWDGIATVVANPAATVSRAALVKKYTGYFLLSAYLLVGPLFYSDVLFSGNSEAAGQEASWLNLQEPEPVNTKEIEESAGIKQKKLTEPGAEMKPGVEDASKSSQEMAGLVDPSTLQKDAASEAVSLQDAKGTRGKGLLKILNVDLSEQEEEQVKPDNPTVEVRQPIEVENVVEVLPTLDMAYPIYLFPVLENAVPIDSTSEFEYYENAWKWYVSPYVMPVYWSGSGLGRAQLGIDVGRYLSPHASLQAGLRYQLSSGDPQMGDTGILTIPIQYRRYFGQSQFKWFLGAGAVIIPGASPGRPFDNSFYQGSLLDVELSGGMIYHPSDKMRFFVSPTWQQPLSGDHGVSVQLGIQFRF